MPTLSDLCETIVEADMLRKPDGAPPSAREIYEYSPTGELFMVFVWYEKACLLLGRRSALSDARDGGQP